MACSACGGIRWTLRCPGEMCIRDRIYSDDCDDLLRDLDGYIVKDDEENASK